MVVDIEKKTLELLDYLDRMTNEWLLKSLLLDGSLEAHPRCRPRTRWEDGGFVMNCNSVMPAEAGLVDNTRLCV